MNTTSQIRSAGHKSSAENTYWERACRFFRDSGLTEATGSYFLHNKNADRVSIGFRCRVSVALTDATITATEDGRASTVALQQELPTFAQVARHLDPEAPAVFLASPDICREFTDPRLPHVLFVQPAIELTFTPAQPGGAVSYAADDAAHAEGDRLLAEAAPLPPAAGDPGAALDRPAFSELAAGWSTAETDDEFLARLADAVRRLQDHPDGKMALTRAYQRRVNADHPFALYELHARANGEYACSHFLCLEPQVFSLGTTPENIFEVRHRALTVDVVAGTCTPTDVEAELADELYENPKQLKEHLSSLTNRQNRFRPFCDEDTIRVLQTPQVKQLRNVCHLHSVFGGDLRTEVTAFDLMENIFPLLGARPKALLAVADAEQAPHRFYGGLVGHLCGTQAEAFLNIRNVLLDHDVIHAKVGTGVIRESDALAELVETRNKISGVLEAVRRWHPSGAPAGNRTSASFTDSSETGHDFS